MQTTEKQIHLCDCNRSFSLDAERLAAAAGSLACHHALCGAELPALEALLTSLDQLEEDLKSQYAAHLGGAQPADPTRAAAVYRRLQTDID